MDNATTHEALKNVSPNDVYAGRQKEVLKARQEKKRQTLARRKATNLKDKEDWKSSKLAMGQVRNHPFINALCSQKSQKTYNLETNVQDRMVSYKRSWRIQKDRKKCTPDRVNATA